MSNRTLIEINHDFGHAIRDTPIDFADLLYDYLRSADAESADRLARYGIRVFGVRHHSAGFTVDWGGIKASEKASPK